MKLKVTFAYGHIKISKISWNTRFSWTHLHVQEPALHMHTGRYFWDNLIHLNIDSIFFWSVPQIESGLKWEIKGKNITFSPGRAASLRGGWTKKAYSEGREGTSGLGIAQNYVSLWQPIFHPTGQEFLSTAHPPHSISQMLYPASALLSHPALC